MKTEAYDREFKVTHGIKDIYKLYRQNKRNKDEHYMSYLKFSTIFYTFNKAISKLIIEEGYQFKMGYRLGYLRIRKTKMRFKIVNGRLAPNRKVTDWGSSRKLWYKLYPGKTLKEIKEIKDKPILYHTNIHTNGEIMRWYWEKYTCNIPNKTVYQFQPVKQNRLDLIKKINEGKYDQYQF